MSMRALIHRTEASAAYAEWQQSNDDCADIDTGIQTLVTLRKAARKLADTETLVALCSALLVLYRAVGTDPTGSLSTDIAQEWARLRY